MAQPQSKIKNQKSKIHLLAILNLTPDSFSDGGAHPSVEAAVERVRRMIEEGADAIDAGGESTRPGANRIDAAEQRRRVLPVIERIAGLGVPIGIDTTRAAVAAAAIDAGASIVNDITAGRDDPDMLPLVAERGVQYIAMHMRGEPATMQHAPRYRDVVAEVRAFLLERAAAAIDAGVRPDRIVLDPGIGFGKNAGHNLELIARLGELVDTGYPVMLGASRKRFLGDLTQTTDPTDRAAATAATTALGVAAGVRMFRVHDVRENRHAADVAAAVQEFQVSNLTSRAPRVGTKHEKHGT